MPKPVSPVAGSCETGYSDVIARFAIASSVVTLVPFSAILIFFSIIFFFISKQFVHYICRYSNFASTIRISIYK